ncbi:hypothetical protein DFAR_3000015 [Desulfarculales bacterium]
MKASSGFALQNLVLDTGEICRTLCSGQPPTGFIATSRNAAWTCWSKYINWRCPRGTPP